MVVFSGKRIVLITCQISMIVNGLEKKLKDLGGDVLTIGDDDLAIIRSYESSTDLFLYYLPIDGLDDPSSMVKHDFVRIIDGLKNKRLILIGENRNHQAYLKAAPAIGNKVWIDRPIDYVRLENEADALLQAKEAVQEEGKEQVERKILIVDDDPAYAKMVREWIKDLYTINIVTAGMQAIKFLAKNKVDMILLDYEMPVADGPQVLEMIRSDPELAATPVVFLTGINSRESIERVLSLKPSGYILKSTTKE
ncbi:MAG: response regulator, partial [Lachnospiraceae bacterium]|nr:response regulator [Lachnospiraceae bacterium]